jgi:hypothetical protein
MGPQTLGEVGVKMRAKALMAIWSGHKLDSATAPQTSDI